VPKSQEAKLLIRSLIEIQYQRNDKNLEPGNFRVRGDTIDVIPAYENNIIRIEIEDERIKSIKEIDSINRRYDDKNRQDNDISCKAVCCSS
jgi:excinuclease UvrABC helicase subunit UvrB